MYEFLATFPNGVVDVLSTVAVQLREDWYGYIHFHKLETNTREITYIKSQPSFIIHYFPPSTFFLNISKIRQAKQFTPIDLNFDLWNPVSKFRSSAFRLLIFQISTKLPSLVNLSKFLIFVNHLQKKKKKRIFHIVKFGDDDFLFSRKAGRFNSFAQRNELGTRELHSRSCLLKTLPPARLFVARCTLLHGAMHKIWER